MPKYAQFDWTAPSPAPVQNWLNTDEVTYPSMPDARSLLELTDDQWVAHFANTIDWAVDNGQLVSYTPPISLPDQAQALLESMLAEGITITCNSLSGVNGVYALDTNSTNQIFQIGTFANSFGFFPSGASTIYYPDINSQMHQFTVAVFIEFLKAVASLISGLQTQAGIMAQGGTPQWPSQQVAIS